MAENLDEEEVVVLKEDDKPIESAPKKEEPKPSKKEVAKEKLVELSKKPAFFAGVGALLLIAVFYPLYTSFDKPKKHYIEAQFHPQDAIPAALDEKDLIAEDMRTNSLERLITKASTLYEKGEVAKALDLYEEVALFSEALSWYNLGVAKMKKGEFAEALNAFDSSLKQNEYKTVSAINAAVCALNLGKEALFDGYIKIAAKNLQNETNAPLFDYYYTLVNYYQDRPFHALVGANKPIAGEMGDNQRFIAAKVHLMFDNPAGATKNLEELVDQNSSFVLGLSYARSGLYAQAEDALKRAISSKIEPEKSRAALLLVLLKNGFVKEAGVLIGEIYKLGFDPSVYHIETKLKDRLFDVSLAQKHFAEHLLMDNNLFLQSLFGYTPFQVIDTTRIVSELDKAGATLNENDIDEAIGFLNGSQKASSVNYQVTLAAKLALNNRLLLAHETLVQVEKGYRNSDVLQYNLALTYAQLGEFARAYEHFRRAYFQNHHNIQAGVYSVMLARYAGVNEDTLLHEISEKLQADSKLESKFFLALLSFYNNNYQATASWLERKDKQKDIRHTLLDLFASDQLDRTDDLQRASKEFLAFDTKSLLANMMKLYVEQKNSSVKQFAFATQQFMDNRSFDFAPLFYGSPIIRDLYIELGLISGNLYKVRELLLDKVKIERNEVRQLMQSLAITNIYMQNHEEAYTIFNALIDEMKLRDSQTLLNAAIASIAANHKENAIALLQLAKQQDPKNYEARYALGLLYLEASNPKGAAVEFALIPEGRLDTHYFDFDIRH